jgi:uncharacterized membrane protein YecN with MAPEG domain
MFQNIAPYAAVLALFYVYLSVRTIGFRRKAKVSVGDGGDDGLLRAIRVHANFAEYVPIALILIALIEAQDGPASLVHGLGTLLIAARVAHAYGLSTRQAPGKYRVGGTAGTFAILIVAATWLIAHAIYPLGQ